MKWNDALSDDQGSNQKSKTDEAIPSPARRVRVFFFYSGTKVLILKAETDAIDVLS